MPKSPGEATTGFSTSTVCAISGVAPSTLHYWAATQVVKPSLRGSAGKRATRWWSLSDLVSVRAVKALRDSGCPLQTLRKAQQTIEENWDGDLPGTVLHWNGVDVLGVGPLGEVESMVHQPGQGVLHLVAIPIGRWRSDAEGLAVEIDLSGMRKRDEARARRSITPFAAAE
jgi:DNA-binding transcriptional MerR regulator